MDDQNLEGCGFISLQQKLCLKISQESDSKYARKKGSVLISDKT